MEGALQSLVAEMKTLKALASDIESMKKLVQKKADNWEVQRYKFFISNNSCLMIVVD